jgi:ABC-type transport system substrate-binding protein
MNFYNRVKKYLFLLASLISTVLIVHIITVYLYDWAEEVSEKWWSFSIGFVDSLPNLDPTLFWMNTRKDFVLSLLYRGLLQYNPESRTMEWDLATCDLWKNLSEVRCNLKEGSLWSDGTKVTIEDVLATYSLLAETDKNKRLQAGLAKFQITREWSGFVFRNSAANTENIEFLTLPIIKKSVAEQMRIGDKTIDPIYSWEYIFDKKDANVTHKSESIHLTKSPFTSRAIYDRLILRFYSDEPSLLEDLGSVNLLYPGSLTEQPSDNRFAFINYTTPDYTSAFINTSKFWLESRKILSKMIANNFEESIKNPFWVDSPSIANTGDIQDEMLEKIWFYRKHKIPNTKQVPKKIEVSPVPPILNTATGSANSESIIIKEPLINPPKKNTSLDFFDTPGNTEKVAVLLTEEIVMSWKVPKNIDTVTINGYVLKGYQAWNNRFLYRARTSIWNLQLWKNIYELKMFSKWKLQFTEKIEIHTTRTVTAKTALELSWQEDIKTPLPVSNSGSAIVSLNWSEIKNSSGSNIAISTGSVLASTGTIHTLPIVVSGDVKIVDPVIKKDDWDTKLYTASGSQATIQIHFIPSTKTVDEDVEKLKSTFESIGFKVELTSISPEPDSILAAKKASAKTYDIFVVSVNLGFIGVNLTPYFHSGQVQDGFNFSGIKNPSLDPLLEEVSTKELPFDQKIKVLKKISDIIRQENISIPLRLYTSKVGTDILVKDFILPEILPESKHIKETLLKSFMQTHFIVDFESKSFQNFIKWSQSKLFES